MQRVAVVGHSFVNHLQTFMKKDVFVDDAFGLDNTRVEFIGVSGLTISKLRRVEHRVRNFKPTVVVVILGDNDIGNGVDQDLLMLRLTAAVTMLKAWAGAAKVIKIDICPRFCAQSYKYYCASYEEVALAVNAGFREQVGEDVEGIYAWGCRGLSFHDARQVNWSGDGVHLKAAGNSLLYQGIRKALQVFKHA